MKRVLIAALAAITMFSSCSKITSLDKEKPETDIVIPEGMGAVRIAIGGLGDSPSSKAIDPGTEDERKIEAVSIYVFKEGVLEASYRNIKSSTAAGDGGAVDGSDEWLETTNDLTGYKIKTVLLRGTGDRNFYVIANPSKSPSLDGVGVGALESDFLALKTPVLTDLDAKLETPLVMSASQLATPVVPGEVVILKFDMKRLVSRIDLVVDQSNTTFTITSARVINGRTSSLLFGTNQPIPEPVPPLELPAPGEVIDFLSVTNTTIDGRSMKSQLYSYENGVSAAQKLLGLTTIEVIGMLDGKEAKYEVTFYNEKSPTKDVVALRRNTKYVVNLKPQTLNDLETQISIVKWDESETFEKSAEDVVAVIEVPTVTGGTLTENILNVDGYVDFTSSVTAGSDAILAFKAKGNVSPTLKLSPDALNWLDVTSFRSTKATELDFTASVRVKAKEDLPADILNYSARVDVVTGKKGELIKSYMLVLRRLFTLTLGTGSDLTDFSAITNSGKLEANKGAVKIKATLSNSATYSVEFVSGNSGTDIITVGNDINSGAEAEITLAENLKTESREVVIKFVSGENSEVFTIVQAAATQVEP